MWVYSVSLLYCTTTSAVVWCFTIIFDFLLIKTIIIFLLYSKYPICLRYLLLIWYRDINNSKHRCVCSLVNTLIVLNETEEAHGARAWRGAGAVGRVGERPALGWWRARCTRRAAGRAAVSGRSRRRLRARPRGRAHGYCSTLVAHDTTRAGGLAVRARIVKFHNQSSSFCVTNIYTSSQTFACIILVGFNMRSCFFNMLLMLKERKFKVVCILSVTNRGAYGGRRRGVRAVHGEPGVCDDLLGLPRGHVQRRDRGRAPARHRQPHAHRAPHRAARGPARDYTKCSRGNYCPIRDYGCEVMFLFDFLLKSTA